MTEQVLIRATRGSDVRLTFGMGINITGRNLEIIEASSDLVGRFTFTITNAVEGIFTLVIDGEDPISIGNHTFRLRLVAEGVDRIALPKIILEVY